MQKQPLLLFSFVIIVLSFLFSSFKTEGKTSVWAAWEDTSALPSFVRAKDYLSKNVSSKSGLVSLSSGLDNDYYVLDSANRTGYLYVEVKTDRSANAFVKRVPLNLSIVIDRSGSMAGEKMAFAKKAASDIVDKLTPEDFVSVVIYDEYIDVIQKATPVSNKDSIKKIIAKIKPRNSTNLWGGSDSGYQQVKTNYRKNYVNRVLLISDGNITAGWKIPTRIIERVREYKDIDGITISTFGVGLDYNETLMTDMAENGAGNCYFIDKADKMAAMFDKELNGLMNLVAQNAELRISLPKGVSVEALYPFKFAQDKNEVVIKFRDLFSEESKGLVMRFRLENGVDKGLRFQSRLTYVDAADNGIKEALTENLLAPTNDAGVYLAHFNKAVAEQVVLFTANQNLENAMHEADRGNFEAAKRYAEANGYFFTSNAAYVNTSKELRKMDSVNRDYTIELRNAKNLSADSVKLMQKSKRALNYQIRSKKTE